MKPDPLRTSRRGFLKGAGALAATALPLSGPAAIAASSGTPSTTAVPNKAPLAPNAFNPLPLGAVRPAGWLKKQMQIQATGLGGHLDETWADVGSNSGWLGGTGESWERGPYFVDGLIPLAWLLDDERLKAKAQKFVDWSLDNQKPNGMFGPTSNDDWWPRMVMLKALAQYQEVTGDPRVIPALTKYFAYQRTALPGRPLRDWGKFRWQDNALVVLWLYNRTGDPNLLELARLLHTQGHDWQAQFAHFAFTQRMTAEAIKLKEEGGTNELALSTHGVNNGQALKAAPVWSLISNKDSDRAGFQQMLSALDQYHGLPNGMFSCDEHLGGRNPSQGSELCTVVESMYSLEVALAILGDASIGDRIETLAYNALPGTFTDDMWAHQYDQEPNQVEVSLHRKPWTTNGPESNLFGLEPHFGCCTANFHQGWPKFAASLWMKSNDDGLVAALYAPCDLSTTVRGTTVRVNEETEYPFKESIRIRIEPAKDVRFPLRLRMPAWAEKPVVLVNGSPVETSQSGGFAKIDRNWKAGDVVEVRLPMSVRSVRGFNDSLSVVRGPLVFSLPIGETWLKLRDRGMTADWQVFPNTQWNYALAPSMEHKVTEQSVGEMPFAQKSTAVKVDVKARKVPWIAVDGAADPVPVSPVASSEPEETITLIPYAAAKLRITAFPVLKA